MKNKFTKSLWVLYNFYNVPKFVVDIWFSTNQAKYSDPDPYGSGFALQIVALYIVQLGG